MVGMNIKTMVADQQAIDAVLKRGASCAVSDFDHGKMHMEMQVLNKYTGLVPCHVDITMGGEQQQVARPAVACPSCIV